MSETLEHPTEQQLRGFATGRLDDQDWSTVEHHLMVCEECARRIAHVPTNNDEFLGALKKAKANEVPKGFKEEQDNNLPFNQGTHQMLTNMGVMGHFVGDLGQPFHNTTDHDGYAAGHGGIHARWPALAGRQRG